VSVIQPPGFVPRQLQAGPIMLDLVHRDAQAGRAWLRLHPREFGLLWRLAESPRTRLTRDILLRDVWRLCFEPETNTLEVHVFRLRRKLGVFGLATLIATDPAGGYRLEADVAPIVPAASVREALDSPRRIGNGALQESSAG
jgi:two-component system, OmpR family, response regulator